jgi:dTMP kinase
MIMRGKFIVLEGIDGSGTTTQTERIVTFLTSLGRKAIATREPSAGPVGRLLREILLGNHKLADGQPVNGETMSLLFAADRMDHIHREISPQLAAGVDVVSDRYFLSSLAYQAEESELEWVTSLARNLIQPDLTILMDLPVNIAFERRMAADRPVERYDASSYLARVAENYRRLITQVPDGYVLDACQSIHEVSATIGQLLLKRFSWSPNQESSSK